MASLMKFTKLLKKQINTNSVQALSKLEEEETLPNPFYKANITSIT